MHNSTGSPVPVNPQLSNAINLRLKHPIEVPVMPSSVKKGISFL